MAAPDRQFDRHTPGDRESERESEQATARNAQVEEVAELRNGADAGRTTDHRENQHGPERRERARQHDQHVQRDDEERDERSRSGLTV